MNDIVFALLICHVLTQFGIAYILGHAYATLWIREWAFNTRLRLLVQLVECPACLGTWTGGLVGSWIATQLGSPLWSLRSLVLSTIVGCLTAGSNYLIGRACGLVPRPKPPEGT